MSKLKNILGKSKNNSHASVLDPANIFGLDPNDLLLLTDPNARISYEQQGRLEELKHDIKFSVRRNTSWSTEELEYVAEVKRLLKQNIFTEKGAYWWTSPHPTVYIARTKGTIRINDKSYKFKKGDNITFQCRMLREENNLKAPLLIGKFNPTSKSMLCGDMKSAMKGM